MNLDQFRAIKEQEAIAAKEGIKEETKQVEQPKQPEQPIIEEKKPDVPLKFNIPGIGEVDIEELKSGYLRQTDYTKKTQEIASMKNEVKDAVTLFEFMKANPEIAKMVVEKAPQAKGISREEQRIRELENEINLQKRNAEIAELTAKDKSFNLVEVEAVMEQRNLKTLTDAYKIWKADKGSTETLDLEAITKQIRDNILKELGANVDTRTTVGGGTGAPESTTVELTAAEKRIAKNLKMSEAEYLRYKNIK